MARGSTTECGLRVAVECPPRGINARPRLASRGTCAHRLQVEFSFDPLMSTTPHLLFVLERGLGWSESPPARDCMQFVVPMV